MKGFTGFSDSDARTIESLADRAIELAAHRERRTLPQTLSGAAIALIEELPGWRNPSAIRLGGAEMGAQVVTVNAKLEGGEDLRDLAAYLQNWFDIIAIRTPSLEKLRQFSALTSLPVINLRTHSNHPCEVLGDLTYIKKRLGSWNGLHVAVAGPDANILRSWTEAAQVLDIRVTQVAPRELHLRGNGYVSATTDVNSLKTADVIITDCWPKTADPALQKALAKYRIDEPLLSACPQQTLFIPCPPVTRGEEVTEEAMQNVRYCSVAAKNFLLHAQNAVMERVYQSSSDGRSRARK